MSSNKQLINHLVAAGVLYSPSLINAFHVCDRILFIPETLYAYAYEDRPLPIGKAQTISQPYTVAIMLELLHPRIGDRVLDIGSGSGWTTALLATAVGKSGFVHGIEVIPRLVEYGNENLIKAKIDNAAIELAEPSILGKPGELFDRILVSASASEMPDVSSNPSAFSSSLSKTVFGVSAKKKTEHMSVMSSQDLFLFRLSFNPLDKYV